MLWTEDEEMMRQCEEVSEEGEKIVKKKQKEMVCRSRVCEEFQSSWFLMFLTEKKSSRKSKGKVVGWSTEKVKQKACNQLESHRGNGELVEEHKPRGD